MVYDSLSSIKKCLCKSLIKYKKINLKKYKYNYYINK